MQCRKKLRWASLIVLFIFLNVGFCLSKLDFEKCVIILYFLSEWVIRKVRWCWQDKWIHLLFSYPLFYKRNICRSFHFLFSGRHCLQEIDVPVEVRNPAGNFDTLGKIVVPGFWRTKSKIWFWHNIDTDFIHTVDFLQGCHLKKILRKTYFSWKPCRS